MVSFRRFVLAIAVLALFAGLASAQVTGGTSGGGSFNCTAQAAAPAQVRVEGYTELMGDIIISCTGGSMLSVGTAVQTVNITVSLANTVVTSRVLNSNGLSEALLLIDEPNTPGGSGIPFTNCAFVQGAGPGGCSEVVGTTTSTSSSGTYGAVAPGTTTSYNVFQGLVSSNQVIFNGVPVLAPVSAGTARVFRITNIRGSANAFSPGTPIFASITVSSPQILPVPFALLTVGQVYQGLTSSVRNAANNGNGSSISGSGTLIQQCLNFSSLKDAAVLRFTEGFSASFKTRVYPTGTVSGAGTNNGIVPVGVSSLNQNVPGAVYQGSESGLIIPVSGGTAGLADFGTRLKATFTNIPTGVTLYVSTTNINPVGNTGVPAATNTVALNAMTSNVPVNTQTSLLAGLVIGEATGAGLAGTSTGFLPLAPATNNASGTILAALTPDANGTATAVWEILTANPTTQETAEFAVFFTSTGNQNAGTPQTSPAGTVAMSFAPTQATPGGGTGAIPRFAPASTSSTFINVTLCQTTLLFPYVVGAPQTFGQDTGISIANTSADVAGSTNQTGSCTLNFFGTNQGATTSAAFPAGGGNIAAGTTHAENVSGIRPEFVGYVIAVCNFQLAHGYALLSDIGIRNWATGYIALVLPNGKRSGFESLGQ